MLRNLLSLSALMFVFLLGVMVFNTLTIRSQQFDVAPPNSFNTLPKAPQHLAEIVKIPTISYDEPSLIKYSWYDTLHRSLEESFPRVHAVLNREIINKYSLLYTWPGSDPKLAPVVMMAHMDVVPVASHAEDSKPLDTAWTYPPFSGAIEEGFVWGRGAMDDKLHIIAMLEAVEFLIRRGFRPARTLYLAFGHDEEIGGQEGAKKIAEYLEAKKQKMEFVLDEGAFILNGLMPGVNKPVAYIGVEEKGYVNLELRVKHTGGHSSRPLRESAIGRLSRALIRLEENPFPAKIEGATQAMLDYMSPEMSFFPRMAFANRWFLEPLLINVMSDRPASDAIMRTTIAPTMLQGSPKANVLPTLAKATVNFRILPGETVESVQERVQQVIRDEKVEVLLANTDHNDPVPMAELESNSFYLIQKTVHQIYPEAVVTPSLMIAGTDSKHFQNLTHNIFRFSPIALPQKELDGFHGINERISLDNIQKSIRFYYQLILNMNDR